jgi:hypothetical protein
MTEKQTIHVNVYGTIAPRAAEFGKGARDLAEIKQATDARRAQRPGDAEKWGRPRPAKLQCTLSPTPMSCAI